MDEAVMLIQGYNTTTYSDPWGYPKLTCYPQTGEVREIIKTDTNNI